ncbi:hypothetical protein MHYP_G00346280 [Metynnis hypsauchen]
MRAADADLAGSLSAFKRAERDQRAGPAAAAWTCEELREQTGKSTGVSRETDGLQSVTVELHSAAIQGASGHRWSRPSNCPGVMTYGPSYPARRSQSP